MSRNWLVLALISLLSGGIALAEGVVPPEQMPGPLSEVRFDQKLGDTLPLDALFRDETGARVRLGDLIGQRPVLLTFAYFDCPMLCPLNLNGLAKSLGVLSFDVGKEMDVIVLSFDHEETSDQAAQAEMTMVERYGRPETADGWHFLVGSEESVRSVTEASGFHFAKIPETDEWAHASGLIVVTPDGKLSQYYYGFEYPAKEIRLAVVEASEEKVGNVVDQILLYCYRYDPQLGRYTAVAIRILRLAGVVFVIGLVLFVFFMLRHDKARRPATQSTS